MSFTKWYLKITDIDECMSDTVYDGVIDSHPLCYDRGQCNNTVGSFYCLCETGFTGRLCETGAQIINKL